MTNKNVGDKKKKIISITMDEELWKKTTKMSKKVNRSLSNFISNILELAFEKKNQK